MGKIRKFRLSWKPSKSKLVVGYRLYWSDEAPVSYNANFIPLGNITDVKLPNILLDVATSKKLIYLGISAVDKRGNESDIVLLSQPYSLSVPPAPTDFVINTMDDFKILGQEERVENQAQYMQGQIAQQVDQEVSQDPSQSLSNSVTPVRGGFDNFGFAISKVLED